MDRMADNESTLSDLVRTDCVDATDVASFVASATRCSVAGVDGDTTADGEAT